MEAGDLRIGDVPVHTLDLGGFPDYFGLDVRGIVGTRLLMRLTPTIDYRGGALVLRRGPVEAADGGIPFWLAETHLILARGRLNGLPPRLFWVDTASPAAACSPGRPRCAPPACGSTGPRPASGRVAAGP